MNLVGVTNKQNQMLPSHYLPKQMSPRSRKRQTDTTAVSFQNGDETPTVVGLSRNQFRREEDED